ncbi:OmpA family protein [Lysobacter antibioticus]|uniref:OmpA family protein n=1 Tax=Lysobacter antibioticus TaxID=84531 RepID=UPI0009EACA72
MANNVRPPPHGVVVAHLLLFFVFCSACKGAGGEYDENRVALASGIEIVPVRMKSGHPTNNESIEAALAEPEGFYKRALQLNAEAIKGTPQLRFEVLGFTDRIECRENCQELSARRAKMVYDWLLVAGVSSSSLTTPVGHGSNMPIGDNETDEGRSRNRRVEINPTVD